MALTPADNEAFLREVDDNLRREQMAGLARRWGMVGGAIVVVALAALALFLWWQSHRAGQAGAESEQLAQVLSDVDVGKANAADPRLATLADSSRDGTRALARMTQAGIAAKSAPAAGAARYRAIADDAGLPQAVRDLAMIRATMLEFDTLPPQQVVARMQPLAGPGGAWFGSAGELVAAADLKMNRRDLAGPLYAKIAVDTNVPASIRGRAAGMAIVLGQPIASAAALKE